MQSHVFHMYGSLYSSTQTKLRHYLQLIDLDTRLKAKPCVSRKSFRPGRLSILEKGLLSKQLSKWFWVEGNRFVTTSDSTLELQIHIKANEIIYQFQFQLCVFQKF